MTQRVDKDSLPLDKPRRTPGHPTKSHIVKTKVDGKEKIIRFGEQGAKTAGKPKAGESERMKTKRASFKARHSKNIAKGKSSPAYWANKVKWADGGAVSLDSLAAKYDDDDVGAFDQLVAAERAARLREAGTPLERYTYEALGLEPGLDRATFLPYATAEDGRKEFAVPGLLYEAGKALITPGAAASGVPLSYEDVANLAGNVMGGGLGVSSPVDGAVAGMAMKQKGGNWLTGNVEKQVESLMLDPAHRDEALMLGGDWERYVDTPETQRQIARNAAINRWLETKLNRYIRNEMGTPEDPVRALAERGTLHMQPRRLGPQATNELRAIREMEGFPGAGLGRSELARRWEDVADSVIEPRQARDFLTTIGEGVPTTERYPWLLKVPPETTVYDLAAGNNKRDLGFEHLIDELKNAMDPNSPLPRNLRVDPKDIDKITVPQAVERVARINDWRNQQAIIAEREGMMANLQATPRVDVPEFSLSFTEQPGGKWVDIPETVDEKGLTMCTAIGKAGGWCTQGEGLAKSYGSGEHRLTALVDAEGRPHAQAKITKRMSPYDTWYQSQSPGSKELQAFERYLLENKQRLQETGPGGLENWYLRWAEETGRPVVQPALDITELKPPGNSFNSERAQEYANRDPQYKAKVTESVLKFLNSGEWGKVNDLQHYNIVDLNDTSSVLHYLDDIYYKSENANDAEMIFNAATDAAPMDTPRFMSRGQFIDFLEPHEPMPPEGFAKGGAVSLNSLAAKYAKGGAVKAYDKAKIDELVSQIVSPGYAAGGAVRSYNAAAVNALVNKVLEGNYG